jgi:hypothetical protein
VLRRKRFRQRLGRATPRLAPAVARDAHGDAEEPGPHTGAALEIAEPAVRDQEHLLSRIGERAFRNAQAREGAPHELRVVGVERVETRPVGAPERWRCGRRAAGVFRDGVGGGVHPRGHVKTECPKAPDTVRITAGGRLERDFEAGGKSQTEQARAEQLHILHHEERAGR